MNKTILTKKEVEKVMTAAKDTDVVSLVAEVSSSGWSRTLRAYTGLRRHSSWMILSVTVPVEETGEFGELLPGTTSDERFKQKAAEARMIFDKVRASL